MKRSTLSVILAAALCVSATPAAAGPIEDRITKANQYIQQKDYKKAIKQYESVLEIEPDHAKTNLLLGLVYATTGDLDTAEKYTQKSIAKESSYSAYNNLAMIYANQGKMDLSIKAYEQALSMNPDAFRSWHQLGLVHQANLDFKKAIDCFVRALELNPSYTDSRLGLGSSYYWHGDMAKALEEVEKLKAANETVKADALAKWIEVKELKKSDSAKPAQPAS